jgi:hypothetical protein
VVVDDLAAEIVVQRGVIVEGIGALEKRLLVCDLIVRERLCD